MTPVIVSVNFVHMTVISVLIGIVIGIVAALLLKYCRFLNSANIQEILILFSSGFVGYVISEIMHYSGIISLFTCSIMLIHYAYYNCSEKTKGTINLSFGTIGFGAEAFVFAYVGCSFFSFKSYDWSFEFIIFEFFFVLIARFIGSVGMFYFTSTVFKFKRQMTFKEVLFLNFSGVIRGAIAFGLVLRMDQTLPNRSVVITTVLTLVIATTVIFGATMTLLKMALLSPKEEGVSFHGSENGDMVDNLPHDSNEHEMRELDVKEIMLRAQKSNSQSFGPVHLENKFSSSFVNVEKLLVEERKHKLKGCVKYWKRFDEFIMKPLLIHDYSSVSKTKKKEKGLDDSD